MSTSKVIKLDYQPYSSKSINLHCSYCGNLYERFRSIARGKSRTANDIKPRNYVTCSKYCSRKLSDLQTVNNEKDYLKRIKENG